MLSVSKKDSAMPANLVCIRFLCFGDYLAERATLAPRKSLTGVSVPRFAYACIFSNDQSKPPLNDPRHYIDGQIMTIAELKAFCENPPAHLPREICHLSLDRAVKEKWPAVVKTRLISNGQIYQDFFPFRSGDSIISCTSRYVNAQLMTVNEVKAFLKENPMPLRFKEDILKQIEKGGWKKVVRTLGNHFLEYKNGDQMVYAKSTVITPDEAREFLSQTRTIPPRRKPVIRKRIEKENWQRVVKTPNGLFEFREGDQLI